MEVEWLKEGWYSYAVLLLNIFVFTAARWLVPFITDLPFMRSLFTEMIATMELCTGVAELNSIYERQGRLMFVVVSFVCFFWWYKQFEWAQACPNGPLEGIIFNTGRGDHYELLSGQVFGAVAARYYSRFIWNQNLTTEHKFNIMTDCQSSLMTGILWGMLLEGTFSFIHRFFYLRFRRWRCNTSLGLLSMTTAGLRLIGLERTGGYFNGILASSLALGCKPHGYLDHFLVYWLGSLLGGSIGRYFSYNLDQVPYA